MASRRWLFLLDSVAINRATSQVASNLTVVAARRQQHSSTGTLRNRVEAKQSSSGQPQLLLARIACNNNFIRRQDFHTTFGVNGGKENKAHVFNVQDKEDFQKNVLQSKTPVIVDFHAAWCGPCKQLGPRLEKIVGEKKGDVVMAKLDIDNPDLDEIVGQFNVTSVPTIVAMVNGKPIDQFQGARDEDEIQQFVDKVIGK